MAGRPERQRLAPASPGVRSGRAPWPDAEALLLYCRLVHVPTDAEFAVVAGPLARIRRIGYRCAYRLARAWWWLRRPRTSGALIAIWDGPRLLLVRTSYRRGWSLPGGFIRPGEDAASAAIRECREEIGVALVRERLSPPWTASHVFESRHDHVAIFEVSLDAPSALPPSAVIDAGEIEAVAWFTADRALAQRLFPPVASYLRQREAAVSSPATAPVTPESARSPV